ncbi:DHHC palmitoyltransferase-domain-containing protein [Bombardia bombarda]|uniref:Palmitoyltransferase n=1 Tax=Bombardia bombarda TaxID=252184 RepID=A0AA39U6V7_9PEZI|nr:DHHC palmitoyltransferase-domain-containing protein [Bombardia bombarda]
MVSAVLAGTRWTTRIIPLILAGYIGLVTYVMIKRICVDFFLHHRQQSRTAIIFLVFYSVLLLLLLVTYSRLWLVVQINPGVVPLGPRAILQRERDVSGKRRRRSDGGEEDLEASRYDRWPDENPDSPGLEAFYSKDVFVCTNDGRPRWCSTCCNWKPDRAHHCSELDRCVKKMDHYCPWVGGVVGETSFKYFVQFTFYAALYYVVVVAAAGLCMRVTLANGEPLDGFVIAILAVSAFFAIFAFAMTCTAIRYICVNLTNVDYVKSKLGVYQLAIRVPRGTEDGFNYGVISYPLSPEPGSSPDLSGQTFTNNEPSSRDHLATRTFAIVKTEVGQNPWDMGYYRNWKSVMGSNAIDWLLPLRKSPCENEETSESFYKMGPLLQTLRTRFDLPDIPLDEKKEDTIKRVRK